MTHLVNIHYKDRISTVKCDCTGIHLKSIRFLNLIDKLKIKSSYSLLKRGHKANVFTWIFQIRSAINYFAYKGQANGISAIFSNLSNENVNRNQGCIEQFPAGTTFDSHWKSIEIWSINIIICDQKWYNWYYRHCYNTTSLKPLHLHLNCKILSINENVTTNWLHCIYIIKI